MTEEQLKARTKTRALRTIQLSKKLPRGYIGDVLGRQLIRSATSVAANYRGTCKARSRPEFISKIGIVEEEIDEVELWLELLVEAELHQRDLIETLIAEAKELAAIFAASRITA
jgi:four helix bundle protein